MRSQRVVVVVVVVVGITVLLTFIVSATVSGAFRLVFTFFYFRCSLDVLLIVSSLCLCAGVLPCMA